MRVMRSATAVVLILAFSGVRFESTRASTTCFGKVVTISGAGEIHGTIGNDVILGSSRNDSIDIGYGGVDYICGSGGNDLIFISMLSQGAFVHGDAGNDSIQAYDASPAVTLYGDAGNDHITGGYGADHIMAAMVMTPSAPELITISLMVVTGTTKSLG